MKDPEEDELINWHHLEPARKVVKTPNMHVNVNIPYISRVLAVEYFFICAAHEAEAGFTHYALSECRHDHKDFPDRAGHLAI